MISLLDWLRPEYWTVYIPLGLIGAFRWGVWLLRKIPSLLYRAKKPVAHPDPLSIITPVYREDPAGFRAALDSWIAERPGEIIAVIDASDQPCIGVFEECARTAPLPLRLIVTTEPGKRPALARGIEAARFPIVALVDSDTLWEPGLIASVLAPFADPRVAGVGTRQNVKNANNLWQRMADIVLDLRYHDEMRFLARVGGQVTCLSGRTAVYRRDVLRPLIPEFLDETFLGAQCNSGDDKRFTYLVQQRGYRCAYQHNARVYTFAPGDFSTFVQQRVRWSRNSWRADLRALTQRWTWRHPPFVLFLLDRTVSPFTALIAPTFMLFALVNRHWLFAGLLALWWLASRTVKLIPHIKQRPVDILLVPAYVPMTFLLAAIKIHALVTLNWQGWLTRGVRMRLHLEKAIPTAVAVTATFTLVALIGVGVLAANTALARATTSVGEPRRDFALQPTDLSAPFDEGAWAAAHDLPAAYAGPDQYVQMLGEQTHVVAPGEDYSSIARDAYGDAVFGQVVSKANADAALEVGGTITLPRVGSAPQYVTDGPPATAIYDEQSQQIVVIGDGAVATLSSIAAQVPEGLVTETAPGEWLLSVPLAVTDGAHLNLVNRIAGGDVDWLKLRSDASVVAGLRALNADIYVGGTRISSWDPAADNYDTNTKDGRAYVLAKNNSIKYPQARLDLINADLGYLGYGTAESYGVSWRVAKGAQHTVTGTVIGSKFHDNYFGAYTFGATDMYWGNNEFYDNIVYGLDPHDDSNRFIVMYNSFHDNGRHGLIFSKRCIQNVIAYNVSYDNKFHGIMLDRDSNDNLVMRNEVAGNTDGVAVFESRNNVVTENEMRDNHHAGIRFNGSSSNSPADNNVVAANILRNNEPHGIYLYGGAGHNVIQGNTVEGSANGIYVRSGQNRIGGDGDLANIVRGNSKGVVLSGNAASANLIERNDISGNRDKGIALAYGADNLVARNTLSGNGDAAVSLNGETTAVIKDNAISENGQGVFTRQCSLCRLIGNDAPGLVVKLDAASDVTIEDQPPGTVHLADTASRVTVIERDGALVMLPRHQPVYAVGDGTAFVVQAKTSNVRVVMEPSPVQIFSDAPVSVRAEDRPNTTWTVAGTSSFRQRVSLLDPGRRYTITVDGAPFQDLRADDSGALEFAYTGDLTQPRTFEMHPR